MGVLRSLNSRGPSLVQFSERNQARLSICSAGWGRVEVTQHSLHTASFLKRMGEGGGRSAGRHGRKLDGRFSQKPH